MTASFRVSPFIPVGMQRRRPEQLSISLNNPICLYAYQMFARGHIVDEPCANIPKTPDGSFSTLKRFLRRVDSYANHGNYNQRDRCRCVVRSRGQGVKEPSGKNITPCIDHNESNRTGVARLMRGAPLLAIHVVSASVQ